MLVGVRRKWIVVGLLLIFHSMTCLPRQIVELFEAVHRRPEPRSEGAIKLEPKYAVAYNDRGVAYAAKGDRDHAIADYTEAIRLDAKLANAYHNRGRAYRAKSENDRAVVDFKEAIRLDAKLAPALKALGIEP